MTYEKRLECEYETRNGNRFTRPWVLSILWVASALWSLNHFANIALALIGY